MSIIVRDYLKQMGGAELAVAVMGEEKNKNETGRRVPFAKALES